MTRPSKLLSRLVEAGVVEWLLIALGVLLLLNPLYVGALHLDDPEWFRYDAAAVSFENGTVDGPGAMEVDEDDVACLNWNYRNCALERHVLEADEVSLSNPNWAARNIGDGHQYAYLDGQFYRTTLTTRNDTKYLTLEQLEREQAIQYVSTRLPAAPDLVRKVVDGGTATTREPLDAEGQLFRDDDTGQLYVLHRTASHGLGDAAYDRARYEGQILETGLTMLLGAVGLFAILRGQRLRLRW